MVICSEEGRAFRMEGLMVEKDHVWTILVFTCRPGSWALHMRLNLLDNLSLKADSADKQLLRAAVNSDNHSGLFFLQLLGDTMISDLGFIALLYRTKIIPTLFPRFFINSDLIYNVLCIMCSLSFCEISKNIYQFELISLTCDSQFLPSCSQCTISIRWLNWHLLAILIYYSSFNTELPKLNVEVALSEVWLDNCLSYICSIS